MSEQRRLHWTLVALVVALFGAALTSAALTDDDRDTGSAPDDRADLSFPGDPPDALLPDPDLPLTTWDDPIATPPTATLTVHDDGCGVIRSELAGEPEGLTWTIRDVDGFQVLQRNAAGETRYRYFRSGTYTVVLQASDGARDVDISNTVTIHC